LIVTCEQCATQFQLEDERVRRRSRTLLALQAAFFIEPPARDRAAIRHCAAAGGADARRRRA
jgi:hypothetical protein